MKKSKDDDRKMNFNDRPTEGRVKQICQNFLIHSDHGLAHRLQEEEFAVHFNRNRTHRHESRLGVRVARDIEEQERQAYFEKQFDLFQQKRKMEENDIAIARQLQEPIQSNRKIQSHFDQNLHKTIDQSSIYQDTSSDEQLARILQEEEDAQQVLSPSNDQSRWKSALV